MSSQARSRPALVAPSPRLGASGARRDRMLKRIATGITVLTSAIAVVLVAAAAVAFAIG